ncbi:hypothetical protein [Roseovarius sp.]|uniref:hypothetical protein n=1 Tax=Roseovarius sp. TaxID=1486281 RepID=UPI00262085DA|nr:hypothetical protein [Roseovarius sp.]
MNDMVQMVWGTLAEFARSDIGPDPAPRWHAMISVQMAHALIGVTLALYRVPVLLVWAVFYVWLAKELLGDIPNGGGAWPVVVDSVADLFFGVMGYITAKSRMEKNNYDQG